MFCLNKQKQYISSSTTNARYFIITLDFNSSSYINTQLHIIQLVNSIKEIKQRINKKQEILKEYTVNLSYKMAPRTCDTTLDKMGSVSPHINAKTSRDSNKKISKEKSFEIKEVILSYYIEKRKI